MKLRDIIFNKAGKTIAILSIVGLFTGCASVTDAGLEQAQSTKPAVEQSKEDDKADQPETGPFETDDPEVIYDEPDI